MTPQIETRTSPRTGEQRPDLLWLIFLMGPVSLACVALQPLLGWAALWLAAVVCFTCTALAAWSVGGPKE